MGKSCDHLQSNVQKLFYSVQFFICVFRACCYLSRISNANKISNQVRRSVSIVAFESTTVGLT